MTAQELLFEIMAFDHDWHIQKEQDEKCFPAKNQAVSTNR